MFDALRSETRRLWRVRRRLGACPWVVVVARLVVGGVFILAGYSKLVLPHAEIVATLQQYAVIPTVLTPFIALLLPWLELVSGTALLIGFGTTLAAFLVGLQLSAFCLVMLGVLLAGIPLEDCGCFGQLGLQETPLQVLLRDLVMLALLVPVLVRHGDVLALDAWGASSPAPPSG